MRFSMVLAATCLLLLPGCGLFGPSGHHPSDTMDTGGPYCYQDSPVTFEKVAVVCNEEGWIVQDITAGWAFDVILHMKLSSAEEEGYLMYLLQDYYSNPEALLVPDEGIECAMAHELRLVVGDEQAERPYESTEFSCDDKDSMTFFLGAVGYYSGTSTCVEWGHDPDAHDAWGCPPVTPSDTLLW